MLRSASSRVVRGSGLRAVWRRAMSAAALPPHHTVATPPPVKGMLSVKQLRKRVLEGEIDTVMVGFSDIYGRLMGKRFDADFFLQSGLEDGTHACNYLVACDMDMTPIPGFKYANWERGYGDFHLVPDIATLRHVSWLDKTAMVLCDVLDNDTHELVPYLPRSIVRRQMDRAADLGGFSIKAATELEYYMYDATYREAHAQEYTKGVLKPVSDVVEDYHLFQSAREEKYNQKFRRHLRDSGVPVENSKGEAGAGQHELNVIFTDILPMSDRHVVYKQCLKEVADQEGISLTFMAKPFTDATGSGCHIHLSLHHPDGSNAFVGDKEIDHGIKCSDVFRHFLGGWIKYTPDVMPFYAPTINSYKRFQTASWAPTRLAWSFDNRTAGYRVVGKGKSLRIEGRIAGADCNPYLAFAGAVASGLAGIKNKIDPPPAFQGNIYEAREIPSVPKTLRHAVDHFANSDMANEAFGEDVVEHYARFFMAEQEAYDKVVTDWERKQYFEQI